MQRDCFTLSKDGEWIGTLHTLTMNAKIRLVPNDNRVSDKDPAYRILVGNVHIGDAWEAKTIGGKPRNYLRLRFDDARLSEPLLAALLLSDNGDKAQLIWKKRREE